MIQVWRHCQIAGNPLEL